MTASLVVPIAIQFAGVRGEELREMARYKVLYFFHAVVWHQGAVRMRISSDQQRYFLFQFPAIEQNHSFISGTQKIAGFESQPEWRPENFGDEQIALFELGHAPPIDFSGAHSAVGFPGVIFHQMAGQDFMAELLQ
jgi:hypothetical protein